MQQSTTISSLFWKSDSIVVRFLVKIASGVEKLLLWYEPNLAQVAACFHIERDL